ncbi:MULTISPECIES: STAS domain-containing protein [unclassified Pseudactinotalea]|uniref:STAS domain-containing protein n=1 Tax=Micrococcales TaxID=85006 RepID=UPI003C7E6DC9
MPEESERLSAQGWVRLTRSHDCARLALGGEIDAGDITTLNDAVEEALGYGLPVDVDTQDVLFMDSMTIAAISRLSGAGTRVRFLNPPGLVRFLLDVTHIGAEVEIVDDSPASRSGRHGRHVGEGVRGPRT